MKEDGGADMQISDKAKAISPSLTLGINGPFQRAKAQGKDVVGFGGERTGF